MKDREVSPGGCVAPFVTLILKAAIDFPSEKKPPCYIINLFVYSTSELWKMAFVIFFQRHHFLFSYLNFLGHHHSSKMNFLW